MISPLDKDREAARALLGPENFYLIYLNCPLDVCEDRDSKGLYKKAREGEISQFTGLTSLYETPSRFDLELKTAIKPAGECISTILSMITHRL